MIKQSPQVSPPKMFRGLLLSPLIITSCILLIAWFIINIQIEELIANRTSDYASSITKISADLSAEPLLNEEQLQLNLLVKNVAKNLYIARATIYSEDGQIVSQFPNEQMTVINSHIPYIEKISYQDVTAGWFKIEINRARLESGFRETFKKTQILIMLVAFFFLSILSWYLFRKNIKINILLNSCQSFLIRNNIETSTDSNKWLKSVEKLSRLENINENNILRSKNKRQQWNKSITTKKNIICYLEFEIPLNIKNNLTELSTAFRYMQESIKSFGAKYQGDILSNLIIDCHHQSDKNAIDNALSIILLMNKLFETLENKIKIKCCITQMDIVHLFNDTNTSYDILITEPKLQVLKNLIQTMKFGESHFLNINQSQIELSIPTNQPTASEDSYKHTHQNTIFPNSLPIQYFPKHFNQHINRKFRYIKENSEF